MLEPRSSFSLEADLDTYPNWEAMGPQGCSQVTRGDGEGSYGDTELWS